MQENKKQKDRYVNIYDNFTEQGITLEQAYILGRVARFNKVGSPYYESNKTISKIMGKSESTVKRYIDELVKKGYLHRKTSKRKRLLSINAFNYEVQNELLIEGQNEPYESKDNIDETPMRFKMNLNKGQNEPYERVKMNYYKIDNKIDNKREAHTREEILSDLKDDFRTKVEQFRGQYSDAMLEDFIGYWCEPFQNPVGQKFLRWQGEKTWDTSRRLRTWAQREVRYKPHVKTVPVLTPQQEEKKRRDEEYIARMNETSEEAQGPGNRIMDERKERMRIALETSKQRAREQYELEDIQAGELHSVDRKRGDGIVDIMGRKV